MIERVFSKNSVEEIIEGLKNENSDFATKQYAIFSIIILLLFFFESVYFFLRETSPKVGNYRILNRSL